MKKFQNTVKATAVLVLTTLAVAYGQAAAPAITGSAPPTPTGRPVPPIVERWMDAWNQADAGGMAALFTEAGIYQDYAFGAKVQGKDGVAGWVALTVQNIPDARGEILDAFRVGDRAAVQWIFSGTPVRMGPVEGTGKSFSVPATSVFFLRGDRIEAVHDYYNRAEIFRQLGLPSDGFAP